MPDNVAARRFRAGFLVPSTVKGRIVVGFALLIVILTAVVVSTTVLISMHRAAEERAEQRTQNASAFDRINGDLATTVALFEYYMLTGDEEMRAAATISGEETVAGMEQARERLMDQGRAADAATVQSLIDTSLRVGEVWEAVAALREQGDLNAAVDALGLSILQAGATLDEFSALSESERAEAERQTADSHRIADITFWLLVSSGGLGLIVALAAAYVVSRSVLGPITGLQNAAQAVSAGDLDFRAPEGGPREIAAVSAAFNDMTEALLDASKRRELEEHLQHEHERLEAAHAQLKETHRQLAETTERLDGVLASTPDILFSISTTNFATLYVNPAVEKVYGLPPADFMERTSLWMDMVHPDDLDGVKAVAGRLMSTGNEETEFRIIRPDAQVRWIRSRMTLVTDAYGVAIRIDGIHSDITELKHAEERRQEALHELGERVKELRALHSVARLLQDASLSDEDLLQGVADELPRAYQYPDITAAHVVYGDITATTGRFAETEWMQRVRFGTSERAGTIEVCYLEERPEADEGPFLTEERKLLESIAEMLSLHLQERHNRERVTFQASLLEAVGQAVIASDVHGKVIYWGGGAENTYGWTPEEAMGRNIVDLMSIEVSPDDRDFLIDRLSADDSWTGELTVHRKNGEPFPALITDAPLRDDRGNLIGIIGVSVDMSERKRMEDALRASEERHRQAIDNSPNPIFAVDRRGRIEKWNAACETVLGHGQEAMGRPYHEFLAADSERARFDELIEQVFRGATVRQEEITLRTSKGSERYMACRLYPVHDSDGNVETCVFANTDITERKLAEEALIESESHWRSLIENTPDVVIIMDRGGKIIMINRVEEGYDLASVIGTDGYQFVEEQHRDELRKAVSDAFEDLAVQHTETSTVSPDGSRHWYLTRVFPVVSDGKAIAATIVASEITERKAAQEALRTSEERFRHIFEFAPDAYYLMDFKGTFLDGNQAAEEMVGYTREELIGKTFFEAGLFGEDQLPIAAELLTRSIAGDDVEPSEITLTHRDGRKVPIEVRTLTIDIDGEKRILGIARDISERRKNEEMIRHLAYHDALTNVPNRVLFEDRAKVALAHAEREGRKLGIISIDVDRLKWVNDNMGHTVGDDLLKSVAMRLAGAIRQGDTVARIGGDEFLVLLTHCDRVEDGEQAAARLVEAFTEPFRLDGTSMRVTISVGLSVYPDHGTELRTLVKHADDAMYRAKAAGRDSFAIYDASQAPEDAGTAVTRPR